MKNLLFVLMILPVICFSQKKLDTRITVTVKDTSNLYRKIKTAFVMNGYIVMDTGNPDTLVTYAKDTRPVGYTIYYAAISSNKVTFWGYYSYRRMNLMGYTTMGTDYQKIFYTKSSKLWKNIAVTAISIGSNPMYWHEE